MLTALPADLARHAVRPLLPGPLDVLRDTILALGAGPLALSVLAERGVAEALALEGLRPDQTRVLQRELQKLGGCALANPGGDRAVLMGSLSALGALPSRLVEWGPATEALGAVIHAAVVGKGMAPADVRAGDHTLGFGARTWIVGVVNATPDSFSGDGTGDDAGAAVERATALIAEGADVIDIGGESTRPHSREVDTATELRRVIPVVRRLADTAAVPLSIDTRKSEVARVAIEAGASIVNDVWGLRGDPDMAAVVAAAPHVALVAMHNRRDTASTDLMAEICADLRASLVIAVRAGIDPARIIVDPGFGFGKTPAQNLEMMRRLGELRGLGRPILLGPSRKSTIGAILDGAPPDQRIEGTIALIVLGVQLGVDLVRVHDVAACRRALRVTDAVVRQIPEHLRALAAPGPTG